MIHYFQLWFLIDKLLVKGARSAHECVRRVRFAKKCMLCHHFSFLQITLPHKAEIEGTNRCNMQQEPHRKNLRHTSQQIGTVRKIVDTY